MNLCLQFLKERNNSRFESYSVSNMLLIMSHITFRDCRVHIFSNLSRNSDVHDGMQIILVHRRGGEGAAVDRLNRGIHAAVPVSCK